MLKSVIEYHLILISLYTSIFNNTVQKSDGLSLPHDQLNKHLKIYKLAGCLLIIGHFSILLVMKILAKDV